jgi:hypothetical protein
MLWDMRNPRKRKQSKSTSKLSYIGLGAVAVIALGLTAFALNQPAPESGAARPAAAITPEPTETLSTLRDSLPAGSNALIIGDSYTQGHAASAGNGYAEVLGRDLGWKTTVNGVGGTGYTAGGGNGGSGTQQFSTRIAELAGPELAPAIVILQGGQNDWRYARRADQHRCGDRRSGSGRMAVREGRHRWPIRSVPAIRNDGRKQRRDQSRSNAGGRPLC